MHQFHVSGPYVQCLKAHNVDTFNVHPTIELLVNRQSKLLPNDIGKQLKDGKECLRVIHIDAIGNKLHIQYVRPIRLTMGDCMKIYLANNNNNKTISAVDHSSGIPQKQSIELEKYNAKYSYFSEENKWTQIPDASAMPPFTDNMVVRLELRPK
jgi:hypothetical protein